MNRFARHIAVMLLVVVMLAGVAGAAAAAAKRYICPPCAQPCDTTHFSAPGICPACGMALVEAGSAAAIAAASPARKKVAVLVFNGAEILDFTGPYEMFGAADCDVYTVAETRDPVTTAMGLTVVPKYTFADAPQPDVLVIPGGGVQAARHSEPTLRYVRDVTARAQNTMSVCNGAFILASAGLLDGLTATTTAGNIPLLAKEFPKIKVVSDRRYVDNGRIITTAGLSAGIDGALHVIERMYGVGTAQSVALSEEYEWRPDAGFARAALADVQLRGLNFDSLGTWNVSRTEGDRNRWDIVVDGTPSIPAGQLMDKIEEGLTDKKWTKLSAAKTSPTSRTSTWRFTGTDGKPWGGTLKLDASKEASHNFTASLSIARAQ